MSPDFTNISLIIPPSKFWIICILEEDRTKQQKSWCRNYKKNFHRICKIEADCIKTENLKQLLDTENYKNSEIIIIEEAQFFNDLFDSKCSHYFVTRGKMKIHIKDNNKNISK